MKMAPDGLSLKGEWTPRAYCPSCGKPAAITPDRTIDGEAYHVNCYGNAMKRINADKDRSDFTPDNIINWNTGGTK